MSKKQANFRLSDEARLRLAKISALEKRSATEILEGLILGYGVKIVSATGTVEAEILPPTANPKMKLAPVRRRVEVPKPGWKK